MKAIGVILAILLSLPALCPGAGAGEIADPDRAREILRESTREHRIQTELPLKQAVPEEEKLSESSPPSAVSEATAQMVLWIAIAVFVVVIAFTIIDNLRGGGSRSPRRGSMPEAARAAVQVRMETARGEADDLAEGGSFAEAMHVLLLQSLNEMRRRLRVSIAYSLTSREILQRIDLQPEARVALADIIGRVEISYFGTHEPGEGEYRACRESFSILTGLLRREAPV